MYRSCRREIVARNSLQNWFHMFSSAWSKLTANCCYWVQQGAQSILYKYSSEKIAVGLGWLTKEIWFTNLDQYPILECKRPCGVSNFFMPTMLNLAMLNLVASVNMPSRTTTILDFPISLSFGDHIQWWEFSSTACWWTYFVGIQRWQYKRFVTDGLQTTTMWIMGQELELAHSFQLRAQLSSWSAGRHVSRPGPVRFVHLH